jgi:hypothetical protein
MENKPLTDDEVAALCNSELDASAGYQGGELSEERSTAMDYFMGEPYGDEQNGRSQVVTREVLETVQGIMPSLMRIFAEQDNLVQFMPVGPEDEQQAQQETDVVSHIFWNENQGFYNLYSFCFDALLSKTGILKCWADKTESVEREEYEGLDDIQLGQLLMDEYADREVLEYELTDEGYNVVFKTTRDECKIKIAPIAPEEFGIAREARSPYVKDANFSYCRFQKTIGQLVEEGYDLDQLASLSSESDTFSEEELARRNLTDESDLTAANHISMRNVWVTECYIRIDAGS